MNDDIVDRLYRSLVEELERRGHPGDRPVKVSDLYQELVPYRAVRSTLGLDLNADYEHALLRLLAGEGDRLRLEPASARDELRSEVDNPYPFVGLFKKFSASDVWVSMAGAAAREASSPGDAAAREATVPPVAAAPPGPKPPSAPAETPAHGGSGPIPLEPGGGADVARPAHRGGPAPARAPMQVHLHREEADPDPTRRLTHVGAECPFCGDDLPVGRRVRFCPHCGGDQRLAPCAQCATVLEHQWKYCISCGHEVAPG